MEISLEGIEATQATQFYRAERHLDAATVEPDNAVPLVAGKPLALRVYPDVRGLSAGKGSVTVAGELWFRPPDSTDWQRALRFPGSVPGQRSAQIDRGDAQQTLNFRIPDQFSRETLQVRTRVWINLPHLSSCYSKWHERTFSFIETRSLRLHLYGVHFRGNGLDLAPPTAAEALHTVNYLRKTYPVSRIEVASYEVIDFAGDLTDRSGEGYARGWSELLLLLSRLRAARVSANPHYALLPSGVPNDGCGGLGSPLGVGASYLGDGNAMAQEIGHIFYRRHAPGCGASNVDPEYPTYGSYDAGSIGEYGFDPANGKTYSPRTSHDFMSYCGSNWVSPYTYRALLDVFAEPAADDGHCLATELAGDGAHLHLSFSLADRHRFELENGLILPGKAIDSGRWQTDHRLELRDEADRLLASRAIHARAGHQNNSGEELHYVESIPYSGDARRLVFVCCSEHAPADFEIPQDELRIDFVSPTAPPLDEIQEGVVHLRWELDGNEPERIAFFLRYTCDGGRTWQPVNIGFEWESCSVDLDRMPGGDDCRFQVIASTGLQTAMAESVPFRVRRKRRSLSIAGPSLEKRWPCSSTIELVGAAHSPDGFARESELIWVSNLQGQLGAGSHLTVHDLAPGDHEIALTAPDGLGGQTHSAVLIRVPLETSERLAKELT